MDREDFLHNFEQIRGRTMRLVRRIPPDKIEWTCRKGEFTLGDLARHIAATERYVFAECAVGRPSRYKGCGRELADGLDNVIAFMERMHSRIHGNFHQDDPSRLRKKRHLPRRSSHHCLEAVALHARTRNSPPRPDLRLSRNSGRSGSVALHPQRAPVASALCPKCGAKSVS